MKYQVKEKLFSFTEDFTIKNEYDEDSFHVSGKFLSIGHKLNLEDLDGNSLYYIEKNFSGFSLNIIYMIQKAIRWLK